MEEAKITAKMPEPVCFGREFLAAVVTFSTMAYILCVQPALMSGEMLGMNTGMDKGALLTSTCIVSAFGSILMGLLARYPFALAPGMGPNFFVVCTVIPLCAGLAGAEVGESSAWQLALGVVLVSGALFFILSILGFRSFLIKAISPSLKMSFGVGIGLLIAYLGLKNAGLIIVENNNLTAGNLVAWEPAIFLLGLVVCSVFHHFRVPGAVLLGIAASALLAVLTGKLKLNGILGLPASPAPVFFKADAAGVYHHLVPLLPSILILCFMDIFDTFGTVIGVGQKAGMLTSDGKLPRCEQVFAADAAATMFGALGGHSTVTTFLESAAGIASGGRTGLTAVLVGVLFLLSLFFSPLMLAVGSCGAVTSCALVFVGILMMSAAAQIEWDDITEGVPAALVAFGIPFTGSIATGIMFGLIVWPWLKLLTGRWSEAHPAMYFLSLLLIAYAVFVL